MEYLELLKRNDKLFLTGNRMTSYSTTLGGGSMHRWNGKYELEDKVWMAPLGGKEAIVRVFDKGETIDIQQLDSNVWRPDRIVSKYKSHMESSIIDTKTISNDIFVERMDFIYDVYGEKPLELKIKLEGVSRGESIIEFRDNLIYVKELKGPHRGLHKLIGFSKISESKISRREYNLSFTLKFLPLSTDKKGFDCETIYLVVTIEDSYEEAKKKFQQALGNPELIFRKSTEEWEGYFKKKVPAFESDDISITKLFYYNYYVSKSNTYYFGKGYLKNRFSCPCKLRLLPMWFWDTGFQAIYEKWLNDDIALSSILNFLESQREDGFIPMTLSIDGYVFGENIQPLIIPIALWEMYLISGDKSIIKKSISHLIRFDKWMKEKMDMNDNELVGLKEPGESGWDNSNRYVLDKSLLMESSPLYKGERIESPDFNTYIYTARCIIAKMARELGDSKIASEYEGKARRTGESLKKMWNKRLNLFSDQFEKDGKKTNIKSAGGIIPLISGLLDKNQIKYIIKHLTNPKEFWTEYPVPCLSQDSPDFNIRDEYRGYWNGRTWPNINWLIIEGLRRSGELSLAKELAYRAVKMEVATGVPFCRESYHPNTGEPFFSHDLENYGWGGVVNDIIIKQFLGIQPNIPENELYISPLFHNKLKFMSLKNLKLGRHTIDVEIKRIGDKVRYTVTHKGNKPLTLIASKRRRYIQNQSVSFNVR